MTIQLYSKHGIPTGIIDDIDNELSIYAWGRLGLKPKYYVYRRQNKVCLLLHRVIYERMTGLILTKRDEIDHINDNPLDNRRENLRLANRSQNMQNTKLRATNTSGYKGVYQDKYGGWNARITHNYITFHLGRHKTPELAYAAYCERAKELFGEFFNAG